MTDNCDMQQTDFKFPLKLYVTKSDGRIRVSAMNQGYHTILVHVIVLCGEWNGSAVILSRRKQDFVVTDQLEPGVGCFMFEVNWPGVKRVKAEAEYIEFTGRSVSKCVC